MKCPIDKIDMIVVEHKKIELDYCTKCAGVWFDSGELELFLETSTTANNKYSIEELFDRPEAKIVEERRKCPICGKKMKKVVICDKPQVVIDSCPQGDGLWFDGGELNQVLSQFAGIKCKTGGTQNVISFLGDTFFHEKKI